MEASLKTVFGEKLRILRANFGFQQKDMAAKFNMGQQSYSDLEMGYTNFTDKKISKICAIFDISFKEFLSIESSSLSPVKTIKKIPESTTVRILQLNHKKEMLEKEIRIIQLERELKRHKRPYLVSENVNPIRVFI